MACTLCNEGDIARTQGHPEHAATLLLEARRRYIEANNQLGEAETLYTLSKVETALGRCKSAEKCLEDALVLARAVGIARLLGPTLWSLGEYRVRWGDVEAAESAFAEALEIYKASGNREAQAGILAGLSSVAWRKDDFSASLEYLVPRQNLWVKLRSQGTRSGEVTSA